MEMAQGGRVGYQVGGRVNLQFGSVDYPLTNAMNNNQEEKYVIPNPKLSHLHTIDLN